MDESVQSSDSEGSPILLPPTPRHRGASEAKRQLLPSFDPFSATSTSRLNKENQSYEVSNTISLHTSDSSRRLGKSYMGLWVGDNCLETFWIFLLYEMEVMLVQMLFQLRVLILNQWRS